MRFWPVILFVVSSNLHTEIYKCISVNGTVYADEPCGKSAEIVQLPPAGKATGIKFSNSSMDQVSHDLEHTRKSEALERDIRHQQRAIEQLEKDYADERSRLKQALDEHLRGANASIWYSDLYSREAYHERKRRLEEDINQLYFEYHANRRQVIDRLDELKTMRQALE